MSNNERIRERIAETIIAVKTEYESVYRAHDDVEELIREHGDVRDERKEFENALRTYRECLQALAMECLDAKKEVLSVQKGGLLHSDEFHDNIQAGHDDAYFGAVYANIEMGREVLWPLQLDEWESEKADEDPRRGIVGSVEAEGTEKYTKKLASGGKVHLVIDRRGMDPM